MNDPLTFMLIWTGNGDLDVGEFNNFCLLLYAKTTMNKKKRSSVTAVRIPIRISISEVPPASFTEKNVKFSLKSLTCHLLRSFQDF